MVHALEIARLVFESVIGGVQEGNFRHLIMALFP